MMHQSYIKQGDMALPIYAAREIQGAHGPNPQSGTLTLRCAEGSTEPRPSNAVTGNGKELMLQAMLSPCCQAVRPSLLAAAVLVLDRQARGVDPLWPASLSRWTGLSGPGSSEFEAAISAVLPGLVKYCNE